MGQKTREYYCNIRPVTRGQPELAEALYLDHVPVPELLILPFLDIPTIRDSSSETRTAMLKSISWSCLVAVMTMLAGFR